MSLYSTHVRATAEHVSRPKVAFAVNVDAYVRTVLVLVRTSTVLVLSTSTSTVLVLVLLAVLVVLVLY